MICKICSAQSTKQFTKKVLHKYNVNYYLCNNCGFMQTDEPFWLNESYENAINFSDIGIANRSILFSEATAFLFKVSGFNNNNKYLDYGAGYGLYVRLMRDFGFNFYWSDEYCENIFVAKFSAADLPENEQKFEVVTAFEVFEHLVDPIREIEKILKLSDSIFFSTNLINSNNGPLEDWHYIAANHGQHIAFYDTKTLNYIAQKYKLNLYTNKNMHFMTKKKIDNMLFKLATKAPLPRLYNTFFQHRSLNQADFELYSKDNIG